LVNEMVLSGDKQKEAKLEDKKTTRVRTSDIQAQAALAVHRLWADVLDDGVLIQGDVELRLLGLVEGIGPLDNHVLHFGVPMLGLALVPRHFSQEPISFIDSNLVAICTVFRQLISQVSIPHAHSLEHSLHLTLKLVLLFPV
jgi:hypothetical protein